MLGRSMEQVDLSHSSLLCLDHLVLLDCLDVLVALERADRVFGEINTVSGGLSISSLHCGRCSQPG